MILAACVVVDASKWLENLQQRWSVLLFDMGVGGYCISCLAVIGDADELCSVNVGPHFWYCGSNSDFLRWQVASGKSWFSFFFLLFCASRVTSWLVLICPIARLRPFELLLSVFTSGVFIAGGIGKSVHPIDVTSRTKSFADALHDACIFFVFGIVLDSQFFASSSCQVERWEFWRCLCFAPSKMSANPTQFLNCSGN